MAAPLPYPDVHEHLRDELWRVWLRVEYQVRCQWELRAATRGAAAPETISTGDVACLFRAAQAEYAGGPVVSREGYSQTLLTAFLYHSAQVEARVAATLSAGRRLPLLDVVRCFALTRWQQAALSFALMPELDPKLLTAYRYLSDDSTCRGLDARLLTMLVYDTPESRAYMSRDLSASSPLMHYRLLEHDDHESGSAAMLYRRLRPTPRLVHLLAGEQPALDPQLDGMVSLSSDASRGCFPEELLLQTESALRGAEIVLVLQGSRGTGKRLLLQSAAGRHGQRLLLIDGRLLVGRPVETLRSILSGLLREARLLSAIPVIPSVDDLMAQSGDRDALPAFVDVLCREHRGPIALTVNRERTPRITERPVIHLTLATPALGERSLLWQQIAALPPEEADVLAARFAVPGGVIALATAAAQATKAGAGPPDTEALDQAVRDQLHDRILRLGRKIATPYCFDDLIVSDEIWDMLWEIVSCVRERRWVRENWGFRGAHGVSVLFSGEPGVGKTMSAAVLARELNLSLYEIDLSQVVSKWIGETEKNLAEVFDAAEPGHVVLLFNEADSLFGKRTKDVRNANDRYANLETNYLLQRLERFGGLAILTTNLSGAIDPAFRRRFAYDVRFPFPSTEMRAQLWRRAIPPQAEVEELDFSELGERFALSGGFIKVAAERSAFVAAALRKPIGMEVVTATVERMYDEHGMLTAGGRLE